MIFTRTCDNSRKIALALRNLGFGAIPIHGQMSQPKRLGALNKFKVRRMDSRLQTRSCRTGLQNETIWPRCSPIISLPLALVQCILGPVAWLHNQFLEQWSL